MLLRAKTYHKAVCRSYFSWPSDPEAQVSACEVRVCAESKISRVFGFNNLGFCCLFSPLFLLFLPHFFSFAGHLVGFILVGNVYRKAFRILGLGERKGRWVVDRSGTILILHGNFRVNVTWFFAFFPGVVDWIMLILVWFERSLHSAHVSGKSCPWPLKLMMSQAEKRRGSEQAAQGRMG